MSLCGTVLILDVVEDVLVHVKCRVSSQTMRVLILVVVEDVLVHGCKDYSYSSLWVLILVVVEDVLVPFLICLRDALTTVLILVVVEDVLVLISLVMMVVGELCLNPCCGGRCSSTISLDCEPFTSIES